MYLCLFHYSNSVLYCICDYLSTYIPNEILLINTLRMYFRSRAHFSLRGKKVSSQLRDINEESY